MRFEAIIFDCDGTLVDSEPLGNRVLVEMLAELGVELSLEAALTRFRGRRMAETLGLIGDLLGRPVPAGFEAEADRRMTDLFAAELRPVEGVPELLDRLPVPFGVASNGTREKMAISLATTGLLPRFGERIFSAYDVARWKPDPELFLHAARALRVRPERCAVVEDSVVGALAGRAAGMTVFGFAPHGNGGDLAAAGARPFARMAELPTLWCASGPLPPAAASAR